MLKVVGAGPGRTGTESLRVALDMLGLGPCYHMFVCKEKHHASLWLEAEEAVREGKEFDFGKIFDSGDGPAMQSTVDFPSTTFFPEIFKQNPDSKVVLSVRDNPEVWAESVMDTIGSTKLVEGMKAMVATNPEMAVKSDFVHKCVWDHPRAFNGQYASKEYLMSYYTKWLEQIRASVPAEQLLEFNVKQGWEPLCKFLGVEVPSEPFPCANSREAFKKDKRTKLQNDGVLHEYASPISSPVKGVLHIAAEYTEERTAERLSALSAQEILGFSLLSQNVLKDIVPVSGTKTFVTTNSRLRRSQRKDASVYVRSLSSGQVFRAMVQTQRSMLEVLGAGPGRTGTDSLRRIRIETFLNLFTCAMLSPSVVRSTLKSINYSRVIVEALHILGFAPCYHMFVAKEMGHAGLWLEAEEAVREGREFDFNRIFNAEGSEAPFKSALDYPATVYFPEIYAQNPNAKVVLSVRDSAEVWADSVMQTIGSPELLQNLTNAAAADPKMEELKNMVIKTTFDHPRAFNRKYESKEYLVEYYTKWLEQVKASVPAEQLLEFNVKQGWEPLCKFLGVDVPSEPFPRKNAREDFMEKAIS